MCDAMKSMTLTPAMRSLVLSPQAGLAVATLLWAGNFIVGRSLRGVIDPLELNFWRWVVALGVLLPCTAAGLAAQWRLIGRHLGLVLALGFTGIALPHACIYTALQTTSAVNALLLLNLAPLLMGLGAALLFHQTMRQWQWQWLGTAVSMAGAVTLIVSGKMGALLALTPRLGDLWMLPAIVGAATHALLLKRTPSGVTQGPLLTASVLAALVQMGPWLLWRGGLVLPSDGQVLASLGYIGVLASALGFFLWNRGVARVGPVRAAPYMYLMPMYGSLLSFTFLDEAVQGFQVAGGGLVLLGLWVARPRPMPGSQVLPGPPVHRPPDAGDPFVKRPSRTGA